MRLVALNGFAGSGKDSVAEILVRNRGYTRIALADPLRDAALRLDPYVAPNVRLSEAVAQYGWEQAKRDIYEVRVLLQRLGTEVVRELAGPDFWVELGLRRARATGTSVVVTDCRFHDEAIALYEAGATILRVTRPGTGALNAHASEAGIPDALVSGHIENSGSLDDLESTVNRLFTHGWSTAA